MKGGVDTHPLPSTPLPGSTANELSCSGLESDARVVR